MLPGDNKVGHTKIVERLWLFCPRPRWKSLKRSPNLLAGRAGASCPSPRTSPPLSAHQASDGKTALTTLLLCGNSHTEWMVASGLYLSGDWGVEPPTTKISDPPAAIKKRKGVDFLCTYALAWSSTSIAKTSTLP